MYKYFTPRYTKDPYDSLDELDKEFPNMSYKLGIHKDIKGTWIIKDLDTTEYGEKVTLENGDIFVEPSATNLKYIKENLNKFEKDLDNKYPVKLQCGITLKILPASLLAKTVHLGKRRKATNEEKEYATNVRYGELAYKLYDKNVKKEEILFTDEDFIEFINLGLTYSYHLSIDCFDSLEIISKADLEKLFITMMGFIAESKEQEIKK